MFSFLENVILISPVPDTVIAFQYGIDYCYRSFSSTVAFILIDIFSSCVLLFYVG